MKKIFRAKTEDDIKKIVEEIAKNVSDYNIFCLYGELGAGKTTFTKFFAKELGISSQILSPTYTIVRNYKLPSGKDFFHIDAYRINTEKDGYELKEIIDRKDAIIVIEWAERIKKILPEKRIDIEIIVDKNDEREIIFRKKRG